MASFVRDLDTPLLKLSPSEYLTLRQAVCGVQIWGGVGQGKTSASKALAAALLRANMGGLVLCAKPEECDLWLSYAKKNGRSRSVVVFDENSGGFNFLSYEIARLGGAKAIGSIVDCLMRVLESCDAATGITGNTADQFWPQAIRMSLTNCLPLLYSATGTVSVADIVEFVSSAAGKAEQYLEAWAQSSFAARTLRKAIDAPAVPLAPGTRDALLTYWFKTWPGTPEKTRGNIAISVASKLDRFRHGRLKDCFCGNTTVVPDMALQGALIILNMPVLTWQEDGIVAQQLFKLMFQRVIESRNGLAPAQRDRPTFMWMDEAQFFLNIKDSEFIATCRSARCCVVCLTQSLPALVGHLGENRTAAADGLIGKFANHVFHGNSCPRTNQWAADLIGKGIRLRANRSRSTGTNTSQGMNAGANQGSGSSSGTSYGNGSIGHTTGGSDSSGNAWGDTLGRGQSENTSFGDSEQMDYLVEPSVFSTQLRNGGPANRNLVDAVWFRAGAKFRQTNGGNYMLVTFKQQ